MPKADLAERSDDASTLIAAMLAVPCVWTMGGDQCDLAILSMLRPTR